MNQPQIRCPESSGQITRALELDLTLDLDLARRDAVRLALRLDRASLLAGRLAQSFDPSLALVLDRARAQAFASADALDRAHALDRARARADALADARASASATVGALRSTLDLNRILDFARDLASGYVPERSNGSSVSAPAGRLVVVAVRLLPTADQSRYGEEWRSELWELAHAGASRRRQAAYALRLLGAALALRGALRDPRRRRAGP